MTAPARSTVRRLSPIGWLYVALFAMVVVACVSKWRANRDRCSAGWSVARTSLDSVNVALRCGTPP